MRSRYGCPERRARTSGFGPQASGLDPESLSEARGPKSEAGSRMGGYFLPGSWIERLADGVTRRLRAGRRGA